MEKLTLTIPEVAEVLGISRAKAYDLAHSDGFPTLSCGRRLLVAKRGLELWVERQTGSEGNACNQ